MKPGRNDPCPCGSGKKYKQCCLPVAVSAVETPAELAWRRIRRANEGLIGKMVQFAVHAYGEDAIDAAWAEFMFWEEEEDWEDAPLCSVFLPWMLHHWSPDSQEADLADESLCGVPPTRAYLDRKGRHLDPTTRRYLEACLTAPFSFHEILACDPGKGFEVRDLIIGDEIAVLEASASQTLQKGDVLFALLVPCDGIVMMEASSPVAIPPGDKLPIVKFRRKASGKRKAIARDSLRDCDLELRSLYLEIVEPILNPRLPELRNTDGDELSLQRLIFDIDSVQEAFDALKHLALGTTDGDLLERAGRALDGSLLRVEIPWLKSGNRIHKGWDTTSLGAIEIDGRRLSVSVNSGKRAARFKRIIKAALGERARYRVTEIQSVEQALAEREGSAPASGMSAEEVELANHPEVKAKLLEMMVQHYDGWLNDKIPALGGKTPLQAVKNPDGREMVEALVSQIERDGRKMMPPLDESITRRLRERLGLSAS